MHTNKIGIYQPKIDGMYFAGNDLAKALKAKVFTYNDDIDCENLIIIGTTCLQKYSKIENKNFKSVAVIFSDSKCCVNYKWWNCYTKENNISVYAMPDLYKFCINGYTPVYQTINTSKIKTEKNKMLTIVHSPGEKFKSNLKGTREIFEVVKELKKKYKFKYRCLRGLTREECMVEKARSNIFIDQLIYGNNKIIDYGRWGIGIKYCGGLGKSGLEAMALKSCVITGGKIGDTEPYFPKPPVIFTNYNSFYDDLENLIKNESLRNILTDNQYEWSKKYTSPEFVAMNVTRHIV